MIVRYIEIDASQGDASNTEIGLFQSTKDGNSWLLPEKIWKISLKNIFKSSFLSIDKASNMANKEFKVQIRERNDPSEEYKRPELCKFPLVPFVIKLILIQWWLQ